LIPSYVRDSSAVIIVYDITSFISQLHLDRSSFENLNKWIEFVREERGNEALIVIVGNKFDLEDKR
jgi:Ras-related protein Rab-6A